MLRLCWCYNECRIGEKGKCSWVWVDFYKKMIMVKGNR